MWFGGEPFNRADSESYRPRHVALKVLGLQWNVLQDTLSVQYEFIDQPVIVERKRDVLKAIASIFDPLGLISPLLLQAKIFMQSLWERKLDWDDLLPKELQGEWERIKRCLKMVCGIQIPRFPFTEFSDKTKFQLIGFCDASRSAYTAVVYLRILDGEKFQSAAVFAKIRLAPIKAITIPRLELLGVLLGVRLLRFVEKHLGLQMMRKILYTDSVCVLYWL